MQMRHTVLAWGLGAGFWIGVPAIGAWAAEAPPAVKSSPLEGLQLQPGDEPLKTFQPRKPDAPQDAARREAMALFMAGRVQQERGEFEQALKAYLAAIEKDPVAIDPYRAAVPLLLQQREYEQARELALSAAKKSPDGFDLVIALAAILAQQERLDDGISLLQAALGSPDLADGSVTALHLHRDLGMYFRLKSDYPKAAEHYKLVFEAATSGKLDDAAKKVLFPEPGQIFDEFGDAFLKAKLPDLALQAFNEASKYRPAKPGLNSYNLATVFRQAGQSQKALDELQEYFNAQLQSRGRPAYELLKELLKDVGKQDELLTRLEELHKQDEHNDVLRYFLADETLDQGILDRAAELYTNGREKISDPRAIVGMISVYRQKRDNARLLPLLAKAFQSVPRASEKSSLQQLSPDVQTLSARFEKQLDELKADKAGFAALTAYAKTQEKGEDAKQEFLQAYMLGKLSAEADATDDALHFYKLAISMRNDPPSLLYSELAMHLLDAQHYTDAIAVLNEAVQHTSSSLQREKWKFLFFLSYAYEYDGDTERALEAVRQAQKLQPNVSQLHYQEAWIVYHARRWDDALAMFEQVINNFSSDKDLAQKCRFHMSNIYVEKGDMPRGEKILEDILAADPENTQANNDLGYLFADQNKNLDRALGMIKKALDQEPENPAYLDSMGWALYRKGDYAEAVTYLEKATSLKHGDDPTIFEHLGDALDQVQRHDEAAAVWKKALTAEEAKKTPSEKLLKSLRTKLHIPATDAAETPSEKAK